MDKDLVYELLDMLKHTKGDIHLDFDDAVDDVDTFIRTLLEPVCVELEVEPEYEGWVDGRLVAYRVVCNEKVYRVRTGISYLYRANVYSIDAKWSTDRDE
jgi:hypothetical protein